ncbi:DUF421 domain-containing protein [soil metagenome]
MIGDLTDVAITAATAVVIYAVVVVTIRVSGKRTLAKLNAFDLVVSVAMGSVMATGVMSREVSLLTTVTAVTMLAGLQWVVARTSVRFSLVSNVVKARPVLLIRQGVWLHEAMRAERVTEREVLQVMRRSGAATLEEVAAVVLESDGSLSVLKGDLPAGASALVDVPGWDEDS